MKLSSTIISLALVLSTASAFVPAITNTRGVTALNAISALAKNAKKLALREYVQKGVEPEVMEKIKIIKEKAADIDLSNQAVGPLQESLTRRKGTLTVIAEYKRKLSEAESGFINAIYDPEILSPIFREYGASAIAVMADERMGGCTYDDLKAFVEEQRRAQSEVPGPIPVINNDLVIDELQIAQTAAYNAVACVIQFGIVNNDEFVGLLKAAKAVDIEVIVTVQTAEEAQEAVDLGARLISVIHVDSIEKRVNVIESLKVPEGQQVCKICNILAKNNKQLQEIEDAWAVRDKGFNCAWVGEALYKSGADQSEHPGAIIKSMRSKSSLKWASPKAQSGRGEGAREYLGDILM